MPVEGGCRVLDEFYQFVGAGRRRLGGPGDAFKRLLIAPIKQRRLLWHVETQ